MPILHDKGSGTVDAYKAFALPTLCLIDKQHRIYTVWAGSVKNRIDEIGEHISFVLKSETVSQES